MFGLSNIEIISISFIFGIIVTYLFIFGKEMYDRFFSQNGNNNYTFGNKFQVISGIIILLIMFGCVFVTIYSIVIHLFTSLIIFISFYIIYCNITMMNIKDIINEARNKIHEFSFKYHDSDTDKEKELIEDEINELTEVINELESVNFFISPFYRFLYM